MTKKKSAPEKPQEEKPQDPKILLVFKGACMAADKKQAAIFISITPEQWGKRKLPKELPDERIYSGKILKYVGRPGAVYEFSYPAEKPTAIFPDTYRWKGFLDQDDRVLRWQAEHDAFVGELELKAREKKGKRRNLIHEQLHPIRCLYNSLRGRERTVFLSQVLAYITGRTNEKPSFEDDE